MIYKLSPSSLNLLEECPRCFWLHYHGKKRPEGIFPSLPSGMDRILKEHFDRFRDKGKMPPELRENKLSAGCRLFDDKEKLGEWRNNFRGISVKDKKGNILHGAVDNILIKGKKLVVLDYKTRGYPCKEDTHEHYRNQINIYNFLLRENGFSTADYGFLLFYYPNKVLETGEVVFDTKLIKMEVDTGKAKRIWARALNVLNGACPRKHGEKICPWCALLSEE